MKRSAGSSRRSRSSWPAPEERPNPLAELADDELQIAYVDAIECYVQRLEYFDSLPEWQRPENVKHMMADPAAWGLTEREFLEWCADLLDHFAEGARLRDLADERRRRLHDGARRAVSSCADMDAAYAMTRLYGVPEGPPCYARTEGEPLRCYVHRRERFVDALEERHGALVGLHEFMEENDRRLVARLAGRT